MANLFAMWLIDFVSNIGEFVDWLFNFHIAELDLSPLQLLTGAGFLLFFGFAVFKIVNIFS